MDDFKQILDQKQIDVDRRRIDLLEKKVSQLLSQLNIDECQIDLEFQKHEQEAEKQCRAAFRSYMLLIVRAAPVGAICGGASVAILFRLLFPELGWELGAVLGTLIGAFLGPLVACGIRDGFKWK